MGPGILSETTVCKPNPLCHLQMPTKALLYKKEATCEQKKDLAVYLTRIYLRYSSHTHTLSAIFNVHSVKEYTHTYTSHPLNISECEENHPADTRNLHLACLIHIHVIEGYRCVCWLTCSLSLTFPPFFHSSIDFLFCQEHGWSLNRWQGTARTFFLHSLSSFFLIPALHLSSSHRIHSD